MKDLSILVGDLSYPIYALHFPIFSWINGLYQKLSGGKSAGIEAATLFAATLILSYPRAALLRPAGTRLSHPPAQGVPEADHSPDRSPASRTA
ncbi:hypothetical protein ACU4GR_10395 (plasmid) [Methylobacterium oryzae CBMB20]